MSVGSAKLVAFVVAILSLGIVACDVSLSTLTVPPGPSPTPRSSSPPKPSPAGASTQTVPAEQQPTATPFASGLVTPGSVIVVLTPTPTRPARPRPTLIPAPTSTPTPTAAPSPSATPSPTQTPVPVPTATPTPAPTAPLPAPTSIPGPAHTLSINGTAVPPGDRVISVANGLVTLSVAPNPDGVYPRGALISLIAAPAIPGYPVVWAGVDSQDGNLATVAMTVDRFVVLRLEAPTPTPPPIIEVSGTISATRRWSSNRTYLVTGDIVVESGATLFIDPGTVIKFAGTEMRVEGTLSSEGSANGWITFTTDSQWNGITILNLSTNSTIYYTIVEKVDGAALNIDDGKVTVANSIFRHSDLGIWVGSSATSITRNQIYSNDLGLLIEETKHVTLFENTIKSNNEGIRVLGPRSNLLFTRNNILSNSEYSIRVFGSGDRDVKAGNNWWGTVDTKLIELGIEDQEDNSALRRILYEPIATAPIENAP